MGLMILFLSAALAVLAEWLLPGWAFVGFAAPWVVVMWWEAAGRRWWWYYRRGLHDEYQERLRAEEQKRLDARFH